MSRSSAFILVVVMLCSPIIIGMVLENFNSNYAFLPFAFVYAAYPLGLFAMISDYFGVKTLIGRLMLCCTLAHIGNFYWQQIEILKFYDISENFILAIFDVVGILTFFIFLSPMITSFEVGFYLASLFRL